MIRPITLQCNACVQPWTALNPTGSIAATAQQTQTVWDTINEKGICQRALKTKTLTFLANDTCSLCGIMFLLHKMFFFSHKNMDNSPLLFRLLSHNTHSHQVLVVMFVIE